MCVRGAVSSERLANGALTFAHSLIQPDMVAELMGVVPTWTDDDICPGQSVLQAQHCMACAVSDRTTNSQPLADRHLFIQYCRWGPSQMDTQKLRHAETVLRFRDSETRRLRSTTSACPSQ